MPHKQEFSTGSHVMNVSLIRVFSVNVFHEIFKTFICVHVCVEAHKYPEYTHTYLQTLTVKTGVDL